jgi:hypothetical protein
LKGDACTRCLIAMALWLLLPLAFGPAASADTTADFDGFPPETVITNQYADLGGPGDGVVFGPLPGGRDGLRPVVKNAPPGQAQSGAQFGDIGTCNTPTCAGVEFYTPSTTGTFQNPRSSVSARVGLAGSAGGSCASDPGACATVSLQAYDANGDPVGAASTATVARGAGFHTLLAVQTPTRVIRGFEISAPGNGNQPVGIDDLSFDTTLAPAPTDFTLTPESTSLVIAPGGAATDRIAIGRTGGSAGDVQFAATGWPDGVHASFEPNPAGGSSTELKIAVDQDSQLTGVDRVDVTVTGTPRSPSVGPVTRRFLLSLQVRGPCGPAPAGTRYCRTGRELEEVLRSPFTGRVVLAIDGSFDLTGSHDIPIRDGVELIGERGPLGSRPLVRTNDLGDYDLFRITGGTVRVEGLHLRGPDGISVERGPARFGIVVLQDPANKPRSVVIADSEFDHWALGAAIDARGTVRYCHIPPVDDDPAECAGPHMLPEDVGRVRIQNNYFHHAKWGYGLVVSGSAYATFTGNVADRIRHVVAEDGFGYGGYVARFNYALESGYNYSPGHYWATQFDVHGTGTPEEAALGHHDGGLAGTYQEIAYNTIRSEKRASFSLRGIPEQFAWFHDNVTTRDDINEAISLKGDHGKKLNPARDAKARHLRVSGNRYDTDYSTEIAPGDFDGDGRTDVFVGNGTAWFYSRAGVRPWEFLRPSNKRVRDLGFADIDGDGITDVLYREGTGRLGWVRSGTAADVAYFTSVPVPIRDLRFGDFDGDGRTDIFYTHKHQWRVWSGASRQWTDAATSSEDISGLLFGEFDDVRGTDVAAVSGGEWRYSSGATARWARLGPKRASSFKGARAADFDGNGKTDIAVIDGDRWRYSPDGRGPLRDLRKLTMKNPVIGRFDGGGRAQVTGFRGKVFETWAGLGRGITLSPQNMR